jgi:hypothetical protein
MEPFHNEALKQFVSGLSSELNTPLSQATPEYINDLVNTYLVKAK